MRNVLIVEDDTVLQLLLAELVTEEGMLPTTASSVEEAFVQLAERRFDCVLLDIQLGDRSAVVILEALASSATAPGVVAISASPREIIVARRFGIGFVSKPFAIDAIVGALDSATRPMQA